MNNFVKDASNPNLAAVESSCCNFISLNNVLFATSNVDAISSDIVPKNALCSTLYAIPSSTKDANFSNTSVCFTMEENIKLVPIS